MRLCRSSDWMTWPDINMNVIWSISCNNNVILIVHQSNVHSFLTTPGCNKVEGNYFGHLSQQLRSKGGSAFQAISDRLVLKTSSDLAFCNEGANVFATDISWTVHVGFWLSNVRQSDWTDSVSLLVVCMDYVLSFCLWTAQPLWEICVHLHFLHD